MFQKQDLTVWDWFLFYILMIIPILNIVIFIIILFSGSVNRTLKSMLWSQVLLVVISVVLFMTLLSGFLPAIQDLISQYLLA